MMMQEKNWNDLASSYKELFTELNEVDEALSIIHKMTDSYTKIEQEYGTKLEQLIASSQAEIEKSCFAKVAVAGFFKLMASNFISSISSLSKSSKNYTSVLHSDVSCSLMKSRSDLSNQIRNINNTIKQLEQKNEPKELTEAKRLFDSVDSVVKSAQEKLPKGHILHMTMAHSKMKKELRELEKLRTFYKLKLDNMISIYEDRDTGLDESSASMVTSQMQETYQYAIKNIFMVNSKMNCAFVGYKLLNGEDMLGSQRNCDDEIKSNSSKVYDHYATTSPTMTIEKVQLEIPEPKKRVKLNAARRDSGIGYSSEENSPSQSPLPTTEVKFKLPNSPETPKKKESTTEEIRSRPTARRSTLQRSTSLMTFPRSCSRSNLSCFVDEDKNRVYTGKEILQKNISKPPISNKAESSRSTLTIFRKKSLKATKEDPSEFPKLRKRESSKPPSGYQYRCRVLFDFDGNDLNSDFYPGSDSAWYQSYSSGINTDLTEWRKECIRVREGDYVYSKSNTSKDSWIEIMFQGQIGHIPFKFIEFLD